MKTDSNSSKSSRRYQESQRDAMGRDHFTTNSKRKHFMCTDRRNTADYQSAVDKLEIRKKGIIKKYEEEIVDCKQIYKQFELQKQGLIPFGSLITGNQNSIKSSVTFRQQNLLKSVRRSLAPCTTHESAIRPVLNYDLISKPPSVPHRIKIQISKREQQRLQEADELVNQIEVQKPESASIYLDDAVAMYAKLRKEVDKEMEKRSHIFSLSSKPMNASKETRPVSVPSKLNIGNGNNTSPPYHSALARVPLVTAPPPHVAKNVPPHLPSTAITASLRLPPASQKISSQSNSNQINKGTIQGKEKVSKSLENKIKAQTREREHDKTLKMEQINLRRSENDSQLQHGSLESKTLIGQKIFDVTKSRVDGEGSHLDNVAHTMPSAIVNDHSTTPKRPSRSVAFALTKDHEDIDDKNNTLTKDEVSSSASKENGSPTRWHNEPRSRSFPALERKQKHYNFRERASSLPMLNTQRIYSDTTCSMIKNDEEGKDQTGRKKTLPRAGKSFEKRSYSIAELSTDKLHQIITEKIIGQITNVQRGQSISSNQKTSILKNYTRMLQSQLKLDDIPESESPDFSDTPFMRSTTKSNKIETTNKNAENGHKIESLLWKNHSQFGSFRSTLSYSDIEEEDGMSEKVRRRLSIATMDAAGIVTQKEKAPKLAKLRMKQQTNSVHEEQSHGNDASTEQL